MICFVVDLALLVIFQRFLIFTFLVHIFSLLFWMTVLAQLTELIAKVVQWLILKRIFAHIVIRYLIISAIVFVLKVSLLIKHAHAFIPGRSLVHLRLCIPTILIHGARRQIFGLLFVINLGFKGVVHVIISWLWRSAFLWDDFFHELTTCHIELSQELQTLFQMLSLRLVKCFCAFHRAFHLIPHLTAQCFLQISTQTRAACDCHSMGFPQLKSLRLGRVFCGKLTCNAGGRLSGDKNTHKR